MVDPIQAEYLKKMNAVASFLDDLFNADTSNRETGFALLVFPFGENLEGTSRVNYISNAGRADMISALKEFLARNEGRYVESKTDDKPN